MPNPTTANEEQPMTLNDTITRLWELLAKATPGEWAAGHFGTDSICQCSYVLSETCMGSICDVSVNNGKLIADGGNDAPPANEAAANLQLIPAMKNALPQLLDALEARESEKPKKTDEELVEEMCVAFYGSDINTKKAEWPTTHEHIKGLCRLGMRAALAVVREAGI